MSDPVDGLERWWNSKAYERRTVVPGLINDVEAAAPDREQHVDFHVGIGDLTDGEPDDTGITPGAPMLNMASGGFFVLMPVAQGSECLGLVVDRASGLWRANKTPGQADRTNGRRSHNLSDLCATPFAYTAPEGAPTSWDGLVIGGPAGVAVAVASDGTVTITAQAQAPGTPSSITMTPNGDITMSVGVGNSVNAGGALELIIAQQLETFLAAAFTAAPVTPGDGGTALKTFMAAKILGTPPPSLSAAAGTVTTKGA